MCPLALKYDEEEGITGKEAKRIIKGKKGKGGRMVIRGN